MIWVAYSSFKDDAAIFQDTFAPPALGEWHAENYTHAWREARFREYCANSVVVTAVSVGLIVGLGAMAAYALARFYHPAGRTVFWLFLAGLMIPAQLAVIPLFFELRALSLLNSRLGLILVYTANGLPFAIFILAGFFRSLPRSLYEAAVIDGCGPAPVAGAPLDLEKKIAGDETTVSTYTACKAGASVELRTIVGGAHIPALSPTFTSSAADWLLAQHKP